MLRAMFKWVKEHPLIVTAGAGATLFFAAWPVFSDRTLPSALADHGITVTAYTVFVVIITMAIVGLQVAILINRHAEPERPSQVQTNGHQDQAQIFIQYTPLEIATFLKSHLSAHSGHRDRSFRSW